MFALLALGGDMGCAGGPTLVGMISDSLGDNLKMGILAGIIFPVLLLLGILRCKKETPFHNVTCKESLPGHKSRQAFFAFFFLYKKLRSEQKTFIYSSRLSFIFPSIPDFFNGSVIMIAIIVPPQVLMRNGTTNINNVAAVFPITRYATG